MGCGTSSPLAGDAQTAQGDLCADPVGTVGCAAHADASLADVPASAAYAATLSDGTCTSPSAGASLLGLAPPVKNFVQLHWLVDASATLRHLLRLPAARARYRAFLEREYAESNLDFVLAVDACIASGASATVSAELFDRFLRPDSDAEVNVSGATRQRWLRGADVAAGVSVDVLLASKEDVLTLMALDSYPRFLQSPQFEDLVRDVMTEGVETNTALITTMRTAGKRLSKASNLSTKGLWLAGFIAVANLLPTCVVVSDARIRDVPMVFTNERFNELTGYSSSEAVGRNCRFLQGPGTTEESVVAIRKGLRAGIQFSVDIQNYTKSGRPFRNILTIRPVWEVVSEPEYAALEELQANPQEGEALPVLYTPMMAAKADALDGSSSDYRARLSAVLPAGTKARVAYCIGLQFELPEGKDERVLAQQLAQHHALFEQLPLTASF
jgi:PAS domain-containing protein